MKKNGEFVGVDEKFIPEDEKYVDESLLGNKEESKNKIKKVAKGIGIFYICLIGFVFLLVAGAFIFCFSMFNKSFDVFTETRDKILEESTSTREQILEESTSIEDEFETKVNSMTEFYNNQVNQIYSNYINK